MRVAYVPRSYAGVPLEILPPIGAGWFASCQGARAIHDSAASSRKWAGLFAAYRAAARASIPAVEACLAAPDFNPVYRRPSERMLLELRLGDAVARAGESEALLCAAVMDGDVGSHADREGELAAAYGAALQVARECPDDDRRERTVKQVRGFQAASETRALSCGKVAEQVNRLEAVRRRIESDLDAARARTLASIALRAPTSLEDDVAELRGVRIAVMGSTARTVALLRGHGLQDVVPLGAGSLPDDLSGYRVLCLVHSTPRLSWRDVVRLHEFVEQGGGVLTTSAAPFYAAGSAVELGPLALVLGARRYGNSSGPLRVLQPSYLTQDLDTGPLFRAGRSAACLGGPLAGVPVACYAAGEHLVAVLANTYGAGRSAYLWRAAGDPANPAEHEKLLLRTLCWLAKVGGATR